MNDIYAFIIDEAHHLHERNPRTTGPVDSQRFLWEVAGQPRQPPACPQLLCTTRCSASDTRGSLTLPPHPAQEPAMPTTPRCPICNQPAADVTERVRDHIRYADCLCPNEHIWETKWLLPTVPIDDDHREVS